MKKYFLGLTAIVLAIAASAFTAPKTITANEMNHRPALQTWYYNGSTLANDRNSAFYQTGSVSCDGVVELPCKIQFDASSYTIPTTNTPLQNYLHSIPSDAAMVNAAVQQKSF